MYHVILLSSPGTDYTNWLRPKFDYNCYKIQLGKIVKAAKQFNYNVKRLPNTLLPCGKKKNEKKKHTWFHIIRSMQLILTRGYR